VVYAEHVLQVASQVSHVPMDGFWKYPESHEQTPRESVAFGWHVSQVVALLQVRQVLAQTVQVTAVGSG
jgi:hypothetical protein